MLTASLYTLAAVLVVVLLVYLYGLARRRAERMQAVIARIEQQFGFRNLAPGGVTPNLMGEINGMKTAVDVCYQTYARGGDAPSGRRPYTRVRVQMQEAPTYSVRIRAQRYESAAEWPAHVTGDSAFDARYVALALDVVDLAALDADVRAAFVAAEQAVSLIGNQVLWVERNHTLDADRLVSAVQSCVDVATAINRPQNVSRRNQENQT